jgi:hypothetical protein
VCAAAADVLVGQRRRPGHSPAHPGGGGHVCGGCAVLWEHARPQQRASLSTPRHLTSVRARANNPCPAEPCPGHALILPVRLHTRHLARVLVRAPSAWSICARVAGTCQEQAVRGVCLARTGGWSTGRPAASCGGCVTPGTSRSVSGHLVACARMCRCDDQRQRAATSCIRGLLT